MLINLWRAKSASATKEYVRAHVEGGVDELTKQAIGFFTEQLTLIEQKEHASRRVGNSPSIQEVKKVSGNHDYQTL